MAPTTVTFDGVDATDVTVTSATELSVTVPAGAAGTVDVVVSTSVGDAAPLAYEYVDAPTGPTLVSADPNELPPTSPGTVTLTGTGLSDVGGSLDGRTYTLAWHDPNGNTFATTFVTVVSDTEITTNPGSLNTPGDYYWVVRDADQVEVSNQLPFTVAEA